jgi:hypothetical protein
MALKRTYEKREDIPKGAEEHYKEADGKWVLDSDHEDVTPLRNAKDHEKKARQQAEADLKAARDELAKLQDEVDDIRRGAVPKGDVEKLEASYKKKLETREAELTGKIKGLEGTVNKHLKDGTATKLAAELFTSPGAGLPHVLSRLTVVEENGEYVTKVLDANGQPSASTIEDLKKEILQNKDLAPILVGSRASGGGANGGQGGGGAPNGGKPFDAANASPKDLAAHIAAKKAAGQ